MNKTNNYKLKIVGFGTEYVYTINLNASFVYHNFIKQYRQRYMAFKLLLNTNFFP